jgi:SAM-dependent methyltransferase
LSAVEPTAGADYTERLDVLSGVWWKRALRPVDPFLLALKRERLGRTLDIGCGLGRNLALLSRDSVGVDHNAESVARARARGLDAVTVEEFTARGYPKEAFDAILVSHVLEHLSPAAGVELIRQYLPYVKHGGAVLLLCPQERGFASDPTHVRWITDDDLVSVCNEQGLGNVRSRSFPLPRWAGKAFIYNEFRVRATKP